MENNNLSIFKNLPSHLWVEIVSFLPFKEAARTSVLSKQWQHVWKHSNRMEFHENVFVNLNDSEENQEVQRRAFVDFVRKFIANYPTSTQIQKFVLSFSKPHNFLVDIQNFINFAVSHNVRELELDFSDPTWKDDDFEDHEAAFELPLTVYSLKNLESLKLFSCKFDPSKIVNFSVLESLSLGWIPLCMETIRKLLRSCRLLETLCLKKCWNIEYFEIITPNLRLKNLTIENCNFIQDCFLFDEVQFKYLKYSGKVGHFNLSNQRILDVAELDFGMETEYEDIGVLICELLHELWAALVLTVCGVTLQILPHGEEPVSLETPLNVQHLILKATMHENEFFGIKFMLKSCPYMEILTLDLGPGKIFQPYEPPYPFDPREFWLKNLIVEPCVKRKMRVMNVKGFRGTMYELHFIGYILYFGYRLEQLNLYIANDGEKNREAYLEIAEFVMKFTRGSENVIISVF